MSHVGGKKVRRAQIVCSGFYQGTAFQGELQNDSFDKIFMFLSKSTTAVNSTELLISTNYQRRTLDNTSRTKCVANFCSIVKDNFFDGVGNYLGIKNLEDWYNVRSEQFSESDRHVLQKKWRGSLINGLTDSYPHHAWEAWRCILDVTYRTTARSQRIEDHRRRDDIKMNDRIGYFGSSPMSYKMISPDCIGDRNGYNHRGAITDLPKDFWKDLANQKTHFDWFAAQLSIQRPEEWLYVKLSDIGDKGKQGTHPRWYFIAMQIIKMHGGSLRKAIQAIYHENKDINQIPVDLWSDIQSQRVCFDRVGALLGVVKMEDWYHVRLQDLVDRGCGELLKRFYAGSLVTALKSIYPNVDWKIWKFKHLPKSFWLNLENQRTYFTELAAELKLKSLDEWRTVSTTTIQEKGGRELLDLYDNSLSKALSSIYPEHSWTPWTFSVPSQFWKDAANHRAYFDWLATQLHIRSLDDWYQVRLSDLMKTKAGSLINSYYAGSLFKALSATYPEHQWDQTYFKRQDITLEGRRLEKMSSNEYVASLSLQCTSFHTLSEVLQLYRNNAVQDLFSLLGVGDLKQFGWASKRQLLLFKLLKQIFPNNVLHFNHRDNQRLKFTNGHPIELDVYLPAHSLAFEYQGEQHYQSTIKGSHIHQRDNDIKKKKICLQHGITVIEIPFWWDGTEASLRATINQHKPNLVRLTENAVAIELDRPIAKSSLAFKFKDLIDVRLYDLPWDKKLWAYAHDEKLRVYPISSDLASCLLYIYWNGTGEVVDRNLTVIHRNDHITSILPKGIPLEGYGRFFAVDVPSHNHLRLEERLHVVQQLPNSGFIQPMPIVSVNDQEHLQTLIDYTPGSLAIRQAQSFYGDTSSFLSVKNALTQAAYVLEARRGVIVCKTQQGNVWTVTCSLNNLSAGSVVELRVIRESPLCIATVKQLPDTWEQVLERSYPYYISKGRSSRATCRGCNKLLEKQELRIQTLLQYCPPHCGPVSVQIGFCLDKLCVDRAVKRYRLKNMTIRPFDGNVWVNSKFKNYSIPNSPGITWVSVPSNT